MYLGDKIILITGATGFIGANLARRCVEMGAVVHVFTRATSNMWRIADLLPKVTDWRVDLLNYKETEKAVSQIQPHIIFHTATYGGYPFQKENADIIQTNVMGTVNLVTACSKTKFELFVNTGSSSEYGIKPHSISECEMLEPVSTYGVAKAAASLFCRMKALTENLPIVTLRLFSPYGYYEEFTRLVPSAIISVLRGENPKFSRPDSVRDFVFIEDVVNSYIKTLKNKHEIQGKIFNIGYGLQHSVRDVVSTVVQLTGEKVTPQWGAVPNSRREPTTWQADISRAKNELGWRPDHDLATGLTKTIAWFRNNMELIREK
ncbi:MAG: NAD(P)-dependent oxidoreductase [bacterium]